MKKYNVWKMLLLVCVSVIFAASVFASAEDYETKNIVKITAIVNKAGGIVLNWERDSYAEGYIVYRKNDGGKYTRVANIRKNAITEFQDKTVLKNGTKYYYVVRSYKGTKKSKYVARPFVYLSRPALKSIINVDASTLQATWNQNKSATGYQLRYKWGSTTATIQNKKNNQCTMNAEGLKRATVYKLYIRSYVVKDGVKYYSAWSDEKTAITRDSNKRVTYVVTCNGHYFNSYNKLGEYSTFEKALAAVKASPYKDEWFIYEKSSNGNKRVYPSYTTTEEKIKRIVAWAIAISKDNRHGYSCWGEPDATGLETKWDRWGIYGDYSCSTLIASAYELMGIENFRTIAKTNGLKTNFGTVGLNSTNYPQILNRSSKFKNVFLDYQAGGVNALKPGDIIGNRNHVAMYIGNGQIVEASMNEKGEEYAKTIPGDQNGSEIHIGKFYGGWTYAYRAVY